MLASTSFTTLDYGRKVYNVSFVHKAYGLMTCPDIIEKLKLNVPSKNLRHPELLRVERRRTLYGYFSRLNLMILHANSAYIIHPLIFILQPSRLLKFQRSPISLQILSVSLFLFLFC